MNRLAPHPSLGGGQLLGSKIVRIVYVDESGRGNVRDEPYFVVAAAITSPDHHWRKLRQHYVDLANDFFATSTDDDERIDEYVFHAKDVWHGSGDFSRDQYSVHERIKLMESLANVPALYGITICFGIIDKAAIRQSFERENPPWAASHSIAYAKAMQQVDTWMKKNCGEDEVASVKAEDTDSVKKTIEAFHEGLLKRDPYDAYYDQGLFKTERIIDGVDFTKKANSPVLQIADHCAWLARRRLTGCKRIEGCWRNLQPAIFSENMHDCANLIMSIPADNLQFLGPLAAVPRRRLL